MEGYILIFRMPPMLDIQGSIIFFTVSRKVFNAVLMIPLPLGDTVAKLEEMFVSYIGQANRKWLII